MDSSSTPSPRPNASGKSLVRHVSLGLAAWFGIFGLTVASLAVWQYWRTTLAAVDEALREAAPSLAAQIVVTNGLLEIEIEPSASVELLLQDDEGYYAVYDASGQLVYGTLAGIPDQLSPEPDVRSRAGYREALAAGPSGSVVAVGRSLEDAQADVRRLAVSLLLASLAGAGLVLLVGIWLRRKLAGSIREIDDTARSLAPGQAARIDVGSVAEEFAGVAAALNAAFDRLDEALAREKQLTSDASHELRTPAATLLAEARWALERPRDAEAYRRSLEVCARQGARMKELVESLLTLARLEAGMLPPARDHVALRALVEQTIADLRPIASEQGVTLHVDGDARISGDPAQIGILVSNLLSNAIRYNRPGGEVRVDITCVDRRALLRVTDTGPGLDPEHAARVFERFWRADPGRSAHRGGSGLGLAISKAIVDAHAGRILVESTAGHGSTFRVELPSTSDGLNADGR